MELYQALVLQASAIQKDDIENITFYAHFIREKTEFLGSLEAVISSFDVPVFLEEDEKSRFQPLYEKILVLYQANMDSLRVSVKSIRKQLTSILLLTKGHSLYNGSSLPEYIDITR